MAGACSVSHAENKRTLPAWMLKACSGNQVAKRPRTEDQNEEALESNVQTVSPDMTNPIKMKTRRQTNKVDPEGAGEVGVLRRCGAARKVVRKSKDAVKDEVEEIGTSARKASGRAIPRNGKKRKLEKIKTEASSTVTTNDEIELTVEDLMSIAEEYVNADKQKQRELESVKTARHEEHAICRPIFADADRGGSVANAPSVKGLLPCTTVARNTKHTVDENNRQPELQVSSSIEMTGDVLQDMVNLLLRPMWRKPAGCEKNSESVESIATTTNHVPEKKERHSELPGVQGQGELVTKKKSSLRDKAALFL